MITINQPASIGDILFLEPMYRHIKSTTGEKALLPVRDHLMFIQDYIPSVNMVPMSKHAMDYESLNMDDPNYLPLRFANQIYRGLSPHDHSDFENMMADKYRLVGLDPEMWATIQLAFNEDRALQLLDEMTKEYWDEYILINENSQAGRVDIVPPDRQIPIFKMCEKPGYTVIDWAFVMLHAAENHHVSTCTFYILQALKNQFPAQFKTKVFLYPRPNIDGLRGISKLNPTFTYQPA